MQRRIKNWIIVGTVAALGAGILMIGLTWSYVTPVVAPAETAAPTSR
ncbi:hypothetical protein Q8W71_19950 [Methylobacterium sp. NEAU 140]|nr:hypothetical protein [Methylobacterium sp. NEAU 140]MDP4024908.1 hypothetical protein [Methylobacterium sp. NEAU 140]